MNPKTYKLASLLGSASLLAMTTAGAAYAQQVAQDQTAAAGPMEVPEQVLVTGSLIHGTAAVGVPVTNLGPQDFATTGSLTTADLFRTIPQANVSPGPVAVQSGANIERATRVNIRGLDTGDAVRTLLLVDGHRFPGQGNGVCEIDPSIVPQLALDRIDILTDGASATYGTAAMAGVINEVLKRGYDGAVTQFAYTHADGGKNAFRASQLWGRTWDGGDITLSYEWYDNSPIKGVVHSNFTVNFTPWGLNDRTPTASDIRPIISVGKPSTTLGTNCTNCYSIPAGTGANFAPGAGGFGPTAPGSAATLNWSSFAVPSNNNANNTVNPYSLGWYDAAQQRNGAAGTLDQRLLSWVSLYADGFWSNRRAQYINPPNLSPDSTNLLNVAIPTSNPYYPAGAPAGLQVLYTTNLENPDKTSAYELAYMYDYGVNLTLPFGWEGKAFISQEYDSSYSHVYGTVNTNAISAALGWTITTPNVLGAGSGTATWTKPATVPYLNLFCDPAAFQCNSPDTWNYVSGIRQFDERYWVDEKGGTFDGPLFDVPAGQVKLAVGGVYTTDTFRFTTFDNTGAPTLQAPALLDHQYRADWAAFAQLNVPVVSESMNIPLVRKLEVEGSWRHDQYSDVHGISVPKIAFNWTVSEDIGLTVRGTWGTSFRAPGFGEISPLANNNIQMQNSAAAVGNAAINITCNTPVDSAYYRLIHPKTGTGWAGVIDNNAKGSALGCAGGGIGGANAQPTGLSFLGDATDSFNFGFRNVVNTDQQHLHPETGQNYSIGGELAPQIFFLKGLDLQATYYSIKISGALRSFGNPTSNSLNDPQLGFAYIVPTDLAGAGVDVAGCSDNNHPEKCAEFEQMVINALNNGRSSYSPSLASTALWINDGGIMNAGFIKMQGLDWSWSYDVDAGSFGAFNIGQTGTYYLHQTGANFTSSLIDPEAATIADSFHTNISSVGGIAQNGVESLPRMRYRARLGWSDGAFSAILFANYQSHFFNTQSAPPNVNFQCTAAGGTTGGGTFPCAISNYTNIEPSYYTFDLSLGYNTGDLPANNYLKNIGIQLVIEDITNRLPPFEYRISTGGGNPAAFDILKSDQGRTFDLIVTKTW